MNHTLGLLLDETLRFEYLIGGVTPIRRPHSTGWRVLPGLLCAQVCGGHSRVFLENDAEVPMPERSLALIAAGLSHRIDLRSARALSRWVHVNFYILDNLDLFSLIEAAPVLPRRIGDAAGDAIEAWLEAEAREDAPSLQRSARRQEFGFRLLRLLAPACRLNQNAAEHVKQRKRLRRVIEHIHEHFAEPLNRDELAKLACASRAQFHRVFRQVLGVAPMHYLRQVRLRQAQQRLLTTELSVGETALQAGFSDVFVFSKFFRRACGLSPTEYRAHLREFRSGSTEAH